MTGTPKIVIFFNKRAKKNVLNGISLNTAKNVCINFIIGQKMIHYKCLKCFKINNETSFKGN